MSTSHETVDNAGSECEQPTSPTRTTSLCAPTSGASHVDPTAGTTSSVCEPDASTSVASDLVDMDRRRLPFPPMRQTVDPDKQKKLRALTGLGANNQNGGSTNGGGGGSSRHGGSSVGRGSRSQKSTSTGGGVKPYRAPVSVSVGGVNLGTITSIGSPITVDPATGQPTIVVGRPSTPNTRGSATTPMSWQLTQPFDSDANDVVVPPAATAAATAAVVSPPPSLVRCRDGSPVLQPDQPTSPPSEPEALPQPQPEQPQQLQAVPPATAENTRKTASAPNSASKAKKPPVSAATGRGQNKASTTEQTSPDRGHPSASAASAVSNNSSPMKPLRLGSTIGSDDDTDGRRDLRASESHASLELLASQNGADRDAIFRTLHRDASSGDLDSATSELSASSPPANGTFPFTVWPTALDDDVFKMLTMDLIPSFKELHERHTLVQHVIECYKEALRSVIPGRFDVKFCIVGSVQTRTCLPDGDIDVAVFVYPHQDCPFNKPLAEAMRSNIHLLGADLMARTREQMSVVDHSIHVESLVFAEVRVLKLVVNGTNIDLTAGQIGGYTTSAFIAEVDHFIGHEHRFRYALMLVKAWCLHDAHIIGGAGGYLSTYAVATILIAVFNQLFRENAPSRELQPLRVLLHFLRYCSEFDFEHHVLSIYGPIPIANVHRFVDELPTAPTNHMVYRCRVGHRLVQKCLRKFSGILNPESQASQQSPTPPQSAFSPSPSGTATPPHATNTTSFPLRPMNIMDPLKPVNNLTRGVNLSHMHRLGTVFRRGRDVLTRLVERHADEPMRVIETFFKGVLNEVSKWPPSDRTVPDGAAMAKCQRCSRPTIFCTDMDYMERMGIGVTSPPTETTEKTAYGYLASRSLQRASAQQAQQQHQQPPLMPLTQGHARAPHSGYNIPPGHHAMPQYVQSPQQTLLPHHHHHHQHHAHAYRGSPGAGAVGQQPYYHASPHQHHHHHHHQGMPTHAGPLPPPALTAPNNNNANSNNKPRSSPNGPTGGHPMPLQHSSPAQQHTSPPGAWGQAPPNASAQGSRGPSTVVGSSTYGVSRPHHDRGNSGGGGGFATHVAHQTPRDLDSYRRNSASAAGISSAGSNGQQLPAPAHPNSTGSSPPVTSAAPNRAAYQPPHARKSDTSPVPTSENSQARR